MYYYKYKIDIKTTNNEFISNEKFYEVIYVKNKWRIKIYRISNIQYYKLDLSIIKSVDFIKWSELNFFIFNRFWKNF